MANLLPIQRKEKILGFVSQRHTCGIDELASTFEVSRVTIHRILNELEGEGKVEKVRGGVRTPVAERSVDLRFHIRINARREQKIEIAGRALPFIGAGDTVFIDSSTTGLHLIRRLVGETNTPVTIVSNSPFAGAETAEARHIQFISTGGELFSDTQTYAGDLTLAALDTLPFTRAFISAGAADVERGLMTNLSHLAAVKRRIIERSPETTLLLDSAKFGNAAPLIIAPLTSVDRLVSDSALSPKSKKQIAEMGLEVIS